jgi:hypothetical protein
LRIIKIDWTADSTIMLVSMFAALLLATILLERAVRGRKNRGAKDRLGEIIE